MISSALFLIYTLACFLSLQAATMVIILIKRKDIGATPSLKAAIRFILVSAVLGAFYYLTYYREFVLHMFETSAFLRALDASVFYALSYSWVLLIDALIESTHPKMDWWRKHTKPVFFSLTICSVFLYVFLLDEYYTTSYFWAEVIVVGAELVLSIVSIVYTLAYILLGYKQFSDKLGRKFIPIVSFFICFTTLWNCSIVISIYIKGKAQVFNVTSLYGTTSIMLLIIDLFTLIYFFQRDFSPVYFHQQETPPIKAMTEEDLLNLLAQNHRLTEREREVMLLAYQGLSNPDIADQLYISRHTVKRHMHNIFEKLDVSTRMELMHRIQHEIQL